MANQETKKMFIDALFDRDIWTRRVNSTQFRTRCPFCGDSAKNPNTGHFYVRANVEDNLPMVYHCFLCEESGIIKESTLALLEIDDVDLKSSIVTLNKTSDKKDHKALLNGVSIITLPYECPSVEKKDAKVRYVEDRLGITLGHQDVADMKLITSLRAFIRHNKIKTLGCSRQIAELLERDYVGFLSYGNSHILFRDITGISDGRLRWVKYPIDKRSSENRIFYSMASEVDIFTSDRITVNLSEGVMDILSVKHNLKQDGQNTINIATTGRYFDAIIMHLVSIGVVGSNVDINIYADNDETFNRKGSRKNYTTTSLDAYKKLASIYKPVFGSFNVHYNLKSKDVGVPLSDIVLQTYRL